MNIIITAIMENEKRRTCEKSCEICGTFQISGISKKREKGIDKWGRIWYSNKAVGAGDRGAQEDEKNLLTAEQKCGNLNKLLLIRDGPDVKKLPKKVLDKRNEIEYNKNVPPRTACTL